MSGILNLPKVEIPSNPKFVLEEIVIILPTERTGSRARQGKIVAAKYNKYNGRSSWEYKVAYTEDDYSSLGNPIRYIFGRNEDFKKITPWNPIKPNF